jgi:hypothetical protein
MDFAVSQIQLDFASQPLISFHTWLGFCWSLHLVLGNCLLTLHRHHALNKIISGFHEKTGNELVTLWSSFWFFQKQLRVVIRVDWPITNRLPTTKHLFISSLYVLHFE